MFWRPNIENDGHLRLERDDIGEVLFEATAEVDAAWPRLLLQLGNRELETQFVGHKVV
jgi:hypothetical protein